MRAKIRIKILWCFSGLYKELIFKSFNSHAQNLSEVAKFGNVRKTSDFGSGCYPNRIPVSTSSSLIKKEAGKKT